MAEIVLVHSPLVGALSLRPTADSLARMGARCQLPVVMSAGEEAPAWRDWPRRLLAELAPIEGAVVVGHSAGGLLAAHLAATLDARALVCLDAAMPPACGPTPPAEPWFYELVHRLPASSGRLPRWHRWWGGDVLATTSLARDFKAAFVDQLPELRLDWFDDAFEMPDWSRCEKHFVRTSKVFDGEADHAERLGWHVVRIDGTHLHPTLQPDETAAVLLEIARTC